MVPDGLISVMPQAWMTSMPRVLEGLDHGAGRRRAADQHALQMMQSLSPLASRYCSRPSQTVGTPAVTVTFSLSSNS